VHFATGSGIFETPFHVGSMAMNEHRFEQYYAGLADDELAEVLRD